MQNRGRLSKRLLDTDRPAFGINGTHYEEFLFRDRILGVLDVLANDPRPLFLYYAPRIAHYPLQAPIGYQEKFSFIEEPNRRVYMAMMSVLDDVISSIVEKLKSTKRWDNTLLIFSSDNGGVVKAPGRCFRTPETGLNCPNGEAGANNYPLRGGKYTLFEGGIRVPAFMAGPILPPAVRGRPFRGIFHIADWYATFAQMLGVDPTDYVAQKYKLPPIDSIGMWSEIMQAHSPSKRSEVLLQKRAIIIDDMKLLLDLQVGASWSGPSYPNFTTHLKNRDIYSASVSCSPACLFNVSSDPTEHRDLAAQHPELVSSMTRILAERARTIWDRPLLLPDPACMKTARAKYQGFLGPWVDDKAEAALASTVSTPGGEEDWALRSAQR